MLAVIEARRAAAAAVEAGIDVFIAPSAFLKAVFDGAGFGGGRMRVVRHGTDGSPRGPVPEGSASGPLKIGFAGTVAPPKGLHILIRAVRKLPEGSYVVDVHGRDDLRPEYARALAREARGLPVRFHGAFDPDQGAGLRDGWDVAVVPSRWVENQPLAILEAHAAGVPVVASDLGGMRELVRDGVDGRLFEPDSPDSLAEVLGELVRDRGGLARLRAGVRPPPTMAEHAAEIESVYADAVAGAGAPR
jgi:glycosyltransferase involved in cell wall biosynthesis